MNCLAQRKKFKTKHPVWADPSEETDLVAGSSKDNEDAAESDSAETSDSDDDDMYAGDVRSKRLKLETKNLQYKHLVDLNNERSFNGGVHQVTFHPKSKIALVSLRKSQADLFEVDGERNRYLQNIKLPKTRQAFCSFTPNGNSIIIAAEDYKGAFYTYDMVSASIKRYTHQVGYDLKEITDFIVNAEHMACRKEGDQEVNVLSAKTYENAFSIKINEPVTSMQFSSNHELFVAGENSNVYIWDLRKTTNCKHKFIDEGTVHITSLAFSEFSQILSIGSDCGVVNTYELGQCRESRFPVPIRTFTNIRKPINILKYNTSGELLLFGSHNEQGAFRLVHSHSGTVYKNFPQPDKRYGHLLSACFSPFGGYLALGCSTGRAQLCRIPYYKSY